MKIQYNKYHQEKGKDQLLDCGSLNASRQQQEMISDLTASIEFYSLKGNRDEKETLPEHNQTAIKR